MKRFFYYTALFALVSIAITGIFSEPEPTSDAARWLTVFILSKAVGFAAGYLAYRLMARRKKHGKPRVSDDEEV